ncbi:SDR family oxidoreductase [Vibrio mangrovi]|uniref:Putative sugar epimerase YhfK n=1 Tax=Vibrio mangrovi TaxID=474394 RepID=A0A1Y6IY13_9VIBR|nr:SDR family oxidoreductase [Vibrio mangrovi]MDW6002556.1 SDR family oxidoreductase [Vibrio mangrovi]SMS01911.1 putative sugar epimerase YhfK [Vibrio mangrovi]
MARIFIVGVTGGVGSRLAPKLIAAGHQVSGLYRQPNQKAALQDAGITPYLADLMNTTTQDLIDVTQGHDIIIFSAGAAGSGLDRTTTIDYETPVKLIEAAQANGISRMYMVSAFMDSLRGSPHKEAFEHYMKMKRQADNALVASSLDWVIVRPGTLVTDDGDGLVHLDRAIPYGTVARGNVAGVLAKLIDTPSITKEIFELCDGSTPIDQAVEALIR